MAVSKVIYGNTTLVDLTSDTVTADKLATGYTAHGADGNLITGTGQITSVKAGVDHINSRLGSSYVINIGGMEADAYYSPVTSTLLYALSSTQTTVDANNCVVGESALLHTKQSTSKYISSVVSNNTIDKYSIYVFDKTTYPYMRLSYSKNSSSYGAYYAITDTNFTVLAKGYINIGDSSSISTIQIPDEVDTTKGIILLLSGFGEAYSTSNYVSMFPYRPIS